MANFNLIYGVLIVIDLNSTLFFKGKFQIKSKFPDSELLGLLVQKIKMWMVPKWKRNRERIPNEMALWAMWEKGGQITSANGIVHLKSVYHQRSDSMQFWACKIIESWPSQNGCAPREWTTEIGFEQETLDRATISIVIYYSDRPGFIGPCLKDPDGSIPKIIKLFVEDNSVDCTIEGYPLDLKPKHLRPGDFPEFWKIVCDEQREVPVIYISPRGVDKMTREGENLVDPQKLVNLLGPNALVYYADDIDFSREMTELCTPSNFGCYSGSIRIYAPYPHIQDADDSYRHRYISTRNLEELGEEVYIILRRALAQDVHFYDKMFRTEDCKLLNDRAAAEKRKQEYRESLENELLGTAIEKEKTLQEQLDRVDDERFQWELDREAYDARIKELESDLYQSKAREDAYRYEAIVSKERKEALDAVREIPKYPQTPEDIARYFMIHFSDRIDFTKNGISSMKDCITRLDILWDALYQMVTLLYDLYENDEVKLVDQEFNRKSKLMLARGEGTMTRKDAKLMRQYTDVYQGKEIDIQAHVKTNENSETSNRFLRIYFYYDSSAHKIIVGSCGKHLDNYTTQKIK